MNYFVPGSSKVLAWKETFNIIIRAFIQPKSVFCDYSCLFASSIPTECQKRLSGSLTLEVLRVGYNKLSREWLGEISAANCARVQAARQELIEKV